MSQAQQWSVILTSSRPRRARWLTESGRLSSDPRRALRLLSTEVAAQRLQLFIRLRGWDLSVLERFQLVPAPVLPAPALPSPAAGAAQRKSGQTPTGQLSAA